MTQTSPSYVHVCEFYPSMSLQCQQFINRFFQTFSNVFHNYQSPHTILTALWSINTLLLARSCQKTGRAKRCKPDSNFLFILSNLYCAPLCPLFGSYGILIILRGFSMIVIYGTVLQSILIYFRIVL